MKNSSLFRVTLGTFAGIVGEVGSMQPQVSIHGAPVQVFDKEWRQEAGPISKLLYDASLPLLRPSQDGQWSRPVWAASSQLQQS